MRSSSTFRGLPQYPEFFGSLNYLYGISDFWAFIFSDKEIVDRTLEATTYQLSDIYSRFLQLCSTVSLYDIRSTFHTQLKLVLLDESEDIDPDTNTFIKFKLSETLLGGKYIFDRPFLPKVTLEEDVHFHISADGKYLELSKHLSSYGFPFRKIIKTLLVRSIEKVGTEYKVMLGDSGYYIMESSKPSYKVGEYLDREVTQYALWLSDCEVDEQMMWKYFGRFLKGINPETTTTIYADFLRGISFLYANGPTVDLLQRGLNLAIGMPFAREDEEIIDIQQDPETGNYNVITPGNAYVLPYGVSPDYEIGDVVPFGKEFAQVASISDYRTKDEWWVNVSIPRTILPYDNTKSTVAAPGTDTEYYMRSFLKYHTFLVNIKLVSAFKGGDVSKILGVIDTTKPSYTLPIYIWTVPIQQDCFVSHERGDSDFQGTPTLRLGDVLLYGEFILRSKNYYPTHEITSFPGAGNLFVGHNYVNVGSSALTDGTVVLIPGAVATAISSSSWRTPARNGERACGRWIRSNSELVAYAAANPSWTGDSVDVLHTLVEDLLTSTTSDIQDSHLIPLYNTTVGELKVALQSAGITLPTLLPKRAFVGGVDLRDPGTYPTSVYDYLAIREDNGGPGLIGYNCGDIPPFILEAKRRFVPDPADTTASETLAFFEVIPGIYSVFLVRATNTIFNPVYFPPREEDELEITQVPAGPIPWQGSMVATPGVPDVYVANGTNDEFPGPYMVITMAWPGKVLAGGVISAPLVPSGSPGMYIAVNGVPFTKISSSKTTSKSVSFVGPISPSYVGNVTNVTITYTHGASLLFDLNNGPTDYCPSFTYTGNNYTNVLPGQAPGIYT